MQSGRTGPGVRAATLALVLLLGFPVAASGISPADGLASDDPVAGDAAFGEQGPAIEGFRSARFGMDESAVRRAIFEDFAQSGAAVERLRNDLEQTTVLTLEVDALLPDAGPAALAYVLGRSGRLIQVTVIWGLARDPAVRADDLEATAALLIAYFNEQGFASASGPEPVVFTDGSNLLFYARDSGGAGVALSALPRRDPAAPAGAPPFLRLAYAADPDNPDVYRTPAIVP